MLYRLTRGKLRVEIAAVGLVRDRDALGQLVDLETGAAAKHCERGDDRVGRDERVVLDAATVPEDCKVAL